MLIMVNTFAFNNHDLSLSSNSTATFKIRFGKILRVTHAIADIRGILHNNLGHKSSHRTKG